MSEIRYDLIHDEYILISPERLNRPIELKKDIKIDIKNCPFCPGNENLTTKEIFSIKKDNSWITRVFPNLYKAVAIESNFDFNKDGINEKWGGFGAHEIIVDNPNHFAKLNNMTIEDIFYWIKTIKQRVEDLTKDKRLVCINVFKNHKLKAGASQPHPHTQLIALPIMSKFQKKYLFHAYNYYLEHGKSLYEVIYDFEKDSDRAIFKTDEFLTYSPYASSFAFESIIVSKNFSNISFMDDNILKELSTHIKKLFLALYKELGDFDYNLLFYIPPVNKNFENELFFDDIDNIFRFFIRVTPRIYNIAGFEILTSSAINPVLPEMAAKLLRKNYENGS